MRQTLSNILNQRQDPNIFLLHNDLFHFETYNSLNLGITEPSTVSIAAGIASRNKTVIIYSIGGFILYRGFDQIKFNLCVHSQPGKVIFCNAGGGKAVNVYPSYMGESHRIRDDQELCDLLGIELIEPNSKQDFEVLMNDLLDSKDGKNGLVKFIRLGRDGI